jgi:hypothetical protein
MVRLARIVIPGLPHHVTQRQKVHFHRNSKHQRYAHAKQFKRAGKALITVTGITVTVHF